MSKSEQSYRPAGRLVPVFGANDHIDTAPLTLSLAKSGAASGETVLLVDCQEGNIMNQAGVIYNKTLADVLFRNADIQDAQYVTSNEHFTLMSAGDVCLSTVLGTLAAISLDYDWVFVGAPSGCSPSHVRLAGAADMSLLTYDSASDHFMRAYWMIDACRRRNPLFDPMLLSVGDLSSAPEAAELLTGTIAAFLGAPPPYMGHAEGPAFAAPEFSAHIIASIRNLESERAAA